MHIIIPPTRSSSVTTKNHFRIIIISFLLNHACIVAPSHSSFRYSPILGRFILRNYIPGTTTRGSNKAAAVLWKTPGKLRLRQQCQRKINILLTWAACPISFLQFHECFVWRNFRCRGNHSIHHSVDKQHANSPSSDWLAGWWLIVSIDRSSLQWRTKLLQNCTTWVCVLAERERAGINWLHWPLVLKFCVS